jgi:precorrin-2 dehydrogenase / sirohydrochlorin ferrochelatase
VACRKVKSLLQANARVRIVAIDVVAELEALATTGGITCRRGPYEPGDLDGVFLVVAATNDDVVNCSIARDARERGMLVAVADAPELGTCTFPAVLRRGGLEIGVSTGGRCPALAVQVRDHIAGLIGDDYAAALEHLAAEREKLLTEGNSSTYNNQVLRSRARELICEFTERKERVP